MAKKYNYFDDEPLKPPKPRLSEQLKNDTQNFSQRRTVVKEKPLMVQKKSKTVLDAIRYVISMVGANVMILFGKTKKKIQQESGTKSGKVKAVIIGAVSMVLVVALMISTIIVSANRVNSRQQKFDNAAFKVCSEYLTTYGNANYQYMKKRYNINDYMVTGVCLVREMDFDNDGLSELLIAYNNGDSYYAEVWAFVGNDFKNIYSKQMITPKNLNDGIWLALYSKGLDSFIAEHDKNDISKVKICSMGKEKFKVKSTAVYDKKNFTYKLRGRDVTEEFERVKFLPLRESAAANMADDVMDTIDGFSATKVSKSANQTANDINSAYYDLVDDYNRKYGVANVAEEDSKNYINGLAVVDLIDFNNDKTKELVLIYRRATSERSEDYYGNYISIEKFKYYCDIYTYREGAARLVYQSEGLSNKRKDTDVTYFLTKRVGNKTMICTNSFINQNYGRIIKASSKTIGFDGEKFEQKFKASYVTEYGYTDYYIDGEYTYKSSFTEKGGFDAPFFNGEESYDSSVWNVVYLQVGVDQRQQLVSQVSKTGEVIKTLNSGYNPDTADISVE